MSGISGIEWTDKTWNPTTGCARVSEGCRNCYAFQLHDQRHAAHMAGKKLPAQYAKPFKELQLFEDRLNDPLSWKKPCRVFVNSMSDLFHKDIPDGFIDRVFAVMALAGRHTFQVLTKRPERMAEYVARLGKGIAPLEAAARSLGWTLQIEHPDTGRKLGLVPWPIPNVWLGTSVENQAEADERIPHLLRTPAAVRFLSCEPLLGPVDLSKIDLRRIGKVPNQLSKVLGDWVAPLAGAFTDSPRVNWVIVGGESGPGSRPCDVAWVRSLVGQCKAAGVACFVKQLGAKPLWEKWDAKGDWYNVPRSLWREPLMDRKGGTPDEWPADLRVREWPTPGPG